MAARPVIDTELCKKDGVCVQTCPMGVLEQRQKGTVPDVVHAELCLSCGQCVAVCPQGALSHGDFSPTTLQPLNPELMPAYEAVIELLRTRRAVRAFRDRLVEKEVVEKIIAAAAFAPSAHNCRSTEFLVVQDREVLRQLTELTAQHLRRTVSQLTNPVEKAFLLTLGGDAVTSAVQLIPDCQHLSQAVAEGKDMILFHAPALLVFHAPRSASFAAVNASLALQNAALAAHSLGVGSFFTGYVVSAWERDDRIRQLLPIPATNHVYGALALGYPKFKYRLAPHRQPDRVQWLG